MNKTIDKSAENYILPRNLTDDFSYNNFQSIAHAERANGLYAVFQGVSVGRIIMFFM
jgi:hypothetical protein